LYKMQHPYPVNCAKSEAGAEAHDKTS
jgi:hypothetical protein